MTLIFQLICVIVISNDSVQSLVINKNNLVMGINNNDSKLVETSNQLLVLNGIKSQVRKKIGKLNPLNKLTFSWVRGLMETGNSRPLEIPDLWTTESSSVSSNSEKFGSIFDVEKEKYLNTLNQKSRGNILQEFWRSPITKSITKMYSKEFKYSGILKFFNTLVQFIPSLLISRLLKISEMRNITNNNLQFQGIMYSLLLLLTLSSKTIIESQYFDEVINLSASIRCTLSAAVYKKSLELSPSSRQNSTVRQE
jgi:hypothetical protein